MLFCFVTTVVAVSVVVAAADAAFVVVNAAVAAFVVVDVSAVVFAVIDVVVSAACNLCVCVLHDDSGCEARRTP